MVPHRIPGRIAISLALVAAEWAKARRNHLRRPVVPQACVVNRARKRTMGGEKWTGEDQMARTLDVILIVVCLGGFVAKLVYKLVLMHRYRNDPAKLEGVVWTDQVFPKRLKRFIYDEGAEKTGKIPVSDLHPK